MVVLLLVLVLLVLVRSLCGLLDGLDLAPDLLRSQAVQPALPCDHQDGKQKCQNQDHGLEPPEEVLLHEGRAAAGAESKRQSETLPSRNIFGAAKGWVWVIYRV